MIQTIQLVPAYEEERIYTAICRSMESLGIGKEIRPEDKVVIKPNLVMAKSPDVAQSPRKTATCDSLRGFAHCSAYHAFRTSLASDAAETSASAGSAATPSTIPSTVGGFTP